MADNTAHSQANSQITVLVVDPNPGIRANLQNMLNQSGMSRVEFAVNAGGAIKQLARKTYDIILCEYDLGGATAGGEGQDGQQFLEDLRHHSLIPPWAIFIMLTSEGSYDKVLSTAELAPTGYVLKPFTAGMLNERIARALARRAALLPAYEQIARDKPRAALDACLEGALAAPRFAFDFARLRAELHATLNEPAAAEGVYRQVLDARPLGWARLGMARALVTQRRIDAAADELQALLVDHPRLMAAYDLLAQCHEAQGEHALAQKTLEDAVAISPHVVRRLRSLGDIALDAGDHAAAEKAYRQVVARSRYSEFRSAEDHVQLVKALVGKGDAAGAGAVLRDMERSLRSAPATPACAAFAGALLHDAGGDQATAVADLHHAVAALRVGATLSTPLRTDLARACLAHQLDDAASEVMLTSLGVDAGVSAQQAAKVFEDAGRPDLADGMHKQLRAQAQILLGVADEKRNMGDVRGAVQTLLEARNMAPNNLQVMIALAGGILRQLLEMGWDETLADLCGEQLERIRTLDPEHPRLEALDGEFLATKRKYGIST